MEREFIYLAVINLLGNIYSQTGRMFEKAAPRRRFSRHLRLTILRPATRFQLFVLSSSPFPLKSSPFSVLSLSLSPPLSRFIDSPSLSPSFHLSSRIHTRAGNKDVPRTRVNYYGASSRFYSPSGWRAYHRHLVSHD